MLQGFVGVAVFLVNSQKINYIFSIKTNKLSKMVVKWSTSPDSMKIAGSMLFISVLHLGTCQINLSYTVNSFREKYKCVNFTRVVRGGWEVVRNIVCQVMSDYKVLLCWKVFTSSLKKKVLLNFGNGVFKWFSLVAAVDKTHCKVI